MKIRKIFWFAWWEKHDKTYQLFQTSNCIMWHIGRLTIAFQKPHTWKYLKYWTFIK